jgi:hypothetical protein
VIEMGRTRRVATSILVACVMAVLCTGGSAGATQPFQQSLNWSGYAVSSTGWVHRVVAQWTIPTLKCDTPSASVGEWVGIGGVGGKSGDLLQTGVSETCQGGHQYNQAWWEMVPSSADSEPFQNLVILRGQRIEALVAKEPNGKWVTRVDDLSTGLSGSSVIGADWAVVRDATGKVFGQVLGEDTGLSYAGGHSAEWIVEDPYATTNMQFPLASYGTVSFGDLHAQIGYPWHLLASQGVEIAHGGAVISVPSLPVDDGFSVSYTGSWK